MVAVARQTSWSSFPANKPPPRSGALVAAPDILVEVVTPTPRDQRRDRVEKMSEYAAFGVSFYWLVDPTLQSFEIFGLSSSGNYETPGRRDYWAHRPGTGLR